MSSQRTRLRAGDSRRYKTQGGLHMIPIYEESSDHLQIAEIISSHFPPHLHQSIELTYVTKGSLVLSTGIDLFELTEGDLAVVFPNLVHHYQVFSEGESRQITLLASPSYFGTYEEILRNYRPQDPVIRKNQLHPNILYSIQNLLSIGSRGDRRHKARSQEDTHQSPFWNGKLLDNGRRSDIQSGTVYALNHAFTQIILARSIPELTLEKRADLKSHDIVYQTVAYIARHYKENISLGSMADALGISPYALSRVFSGSFHQNFNHYLNDVRLEHASVLLAESDLPITDVFLDCGFQSQATFNRVFQARYHTTPRAFRQQAALSQERPEETHIPVILPYEDT